jgi:hypothetical protein
MQILPFNEAYRWLREAKNPEIDPHLLLGNGFSMAYDYERFSYTALKGRAMEDGQISELSARFFADMNTVDFELVIRALDEAARALRILRNDPDDPEAASVSQEASKLREGLAQALAALHPDRPGDIRIDAYKRVYEFLGKFDKIYTANYDLLLYWTLMQDFEDLDEVDRPRRRKTDDGFREPDRSQAEYVSWDHLHSSRTQCINYIHGALHLYRNEDELRKLTWSRTDRPLIDQIREQLNQGLFPLYVSEGTTREKLSRIYTSDYLARGLRSIAALPYGMLAYGLSFAENDEHLTRALVESNVKRLAVSVFGDPKSPRNQATIAAVAALPARRDGYRGTRGNALQVEFFDASDVRLWT